MAASSQIRRFSQSLFRDALGSVGPELRRLLSRIAFSFSCAGSFCQICICSMLPKA